MEWKISPTFPAYEISESGDVRRCKADRFGNLLGCQIKPYLKNGYRRYGLWKGPKQHHVKAARLVIEAFVGLKPFEGAEVCHADGDKKNDHWSNLRWDTHVGNMADKEIHGTSYRGSRHFLAKLFEADVVKIKADLASGVSHYDIAAAYNVNPNTIRSIREGRSWRHI